MCTVTVVPIGEGFRIACNRDESNDRPVAIPPQVRRFGRRWAILPIDPVSDGTWIAVNDAGLAMALLNRNPPLEMHGRRTPPLSRGTIIPELLHCDDICQARRRACIYAAKSVASFRLILVSNDQLVDVSVVHERLHVIERPRPDSPLLFTSSGLGDELVEGPRRQLFQEWFRPENDWVRQQDRFHRHSWPGQQHLSVCMRREEARTVSCTVIERRADSATLTYLPQAPDTPGPCVSLSVPLQTMVAS